MKLFRSVFRKIEETYSQEGIRRISEYVDAVRQAIQAPQNGRFPQDRLAQDKSTKDLLKFKAATPPQLAQPDSSSAKPPFTLSALAPASLKFPGVSDQRKLLGKASRSPIVLAIAVLSLTSALGYRFYNSPRLDIGKTSTQSIYAPTSATVEDAKATEESRKVARKDSVTVLKLDQEVKRQVERQIQQQIQQGNDLRRLAGSFPYTKTAALSLRMQAYLRRLSDTEWEALMVAVDPKMAESVLGISGENENKAQKPKVDGDWKQAIAELKAYRKSVDLGVYLLLLQDVNEGRAKYAAALSIVSQPVSPNLPPTFEISLLDLTDRDWQQIQTRVPIIAERMLTQGVSPNLPQNLVNDAIKLQVKGNLSSGAEPFAEQILATLLRPNLIRDEDQTRIWAEQAARGIQPVMVSVRRGEAIVHAGKVIDSKDFALLDHFGLSRRETNWLGLLGFGALVSGAVAVVWLVKRRYSITLRRRDGILLWLLSLSTPLLITLMPSTNLPAVGLLIGSFFGAPLGITMTGLLAVLLAVGVEMKWSYLLSSAAGGLLCGWLGGRLRSREELALLGLAVGLLQGGIYLLLNVASGTVWYTLLGASAFHALIGLAWVIVGMGSSPYLEQVFDLVTTIRLVELANPNRPLLKRLSAEVPGTFQHTLFVSTLAEAAARALGCNVELVRTGTLYHDIGKMHDPQGFIENQMGGPNKHDLIDDPWVSAVIIKKHVTEGLVMARKFRLPKAVQAFIPEHQGTMLVAYFYHQAQQRSQSGETGETAEISVLLPVNEADFRYDGPIPQSRETGIVMLADSCEAALRSLKDVTPEAALAMINKILRARWQDHQLVDSGLTRDEMTQIATIFVEVWQQFNHKRIAYPKLSSDPQPLINS